MNRQNYQPKRMIRFTPSYAINEHIPDIDIPAYKIKGQFDTLRMKGYNHVTRTVTNEIYFFCKS